MSENFRGTDSAGRLVVVKQLAGAEPSTHSRLLSVCSLWGNLPDTLTPQVREWGKARGFSVVAAAVDAESLRTLMSAATAAQLRPTPHELVSIIYEIAAQLYDLHERGADAVHGDLCASTVLIDPNGTLMLDDIGLARALGRTPAGPARFEPVTLSPEQLIDQNTPASDIFRLGLILYELMMLRPLFNVSSIAELEPMVRTYRGMPAIGINHPLLPLLTSMLALNPAERPSAQKVQQALTQVAQAARLRVGPESLQEYFARVLPTRPQPEPLAAPIEFSTSTTTGEHPAPVTGTAFGKISTTKMTAAELQAAREAEAAAAAAAAAALLPPPPELTLDQKVGQHLVAEKKITEAQCQAALEVVEALGGTIGEALLADGISSDDEILLAEAAVTQTNPITSDKLLGLQPNAELLARLPEAEAEELLVVPLALKPPANILVAMRNPADAAVIERLTRTMQATSVTGLRASAKALKRTIGRFYRGVDEDDSGDWLDRGPSSHSSRAAPAPALELEQEPAAVASAAGLSAPGLPMAPGDEVFPLLDALLNALGAGGQEVRRNLDWLVRVARRMGLSSQPMQQVRAGFAAGLISNLLERRRLLDAPKESALRSLCQAGWSRVSPVVREWLDDAPAADGLPAIIHGLRVLASESGSLSNHGIAPSTWSALATRMRVSPEVARAIGTELSRE